MVKSFRVFGDKLPCFRGLQWKAKVVLPNMPPQNLNSRPEDEVARSESLSSKGFKALVASGQDGLKASQEASCTSQQAPKLSPTLAARKPKHHHQL